ncbi:MAG: GNAT family N-acetyltransferase [Bryobacterales bacterium]|nr:GNAT family N-acetyltransferase [Bryobacterales bacterium]
MPIEVRPLEARDLEATERIFREAFGTAHGVADPVRYMQDRNYVRSRWTADPAGALVAEIEGVVAGSVFAASWGSVGVLGPLTVDPRYWNAGVASHLLQAILENHRMRDARLPALSTAAGNVATVRLYQRHGFWPGFLIPILAKTLSRREGGTEPSEGKAQAQCYSALSLERKGVACKRFAALAGAVFEGLDLSGETLSVEQQRLGETLLVGSNDRVDAFAICHCGAGTEAGEGACYVKFGAARSAGAFELLLDAVEALARARGLSRIVAGVNAGRRTAYLLLLGRGYRAASHAVAMVRGSAKSYDGPDAFVIDDWR